MTALFDLTGRAALVTGGGSGIGLAMATGLAGAGAAVSLWGRDAAKLDRAAGTIAAAGGTAHIQQVDVSDESAVIAGVRRAVEVMGRLDFVVVNAGIGVPRVPLVDTTTEDYRRVIATNLDGAFWTLRESARVMVDRARAGEPGGSIIAVASLAAIEGAGRNHAYGAAKAGVTAMVRSAAVELARHEIRVNGVLPGWIATDMTTEAQGSHAFTDRVISRIPAGRWGRPEDLAGVAVFLASDASAYQTGSTIVVDGGYSIF